MTKQVNSGSLQIQGSGGAMTGDIDIHKIDGIKVQNYIQVILKPQRDFSHEKKNLYNLMKQKFVFKGSMYG